MKDTRNQQQINRMSMCVQCTTDKHCCLRISSFPINDVQEPCLLKSLKAPSQDKGCSKQLHLIKSAHIIKNHLGSQEQYFKFFNFLYCRVFLGHCSRQCAPFFVSLQRVSGGVYNSAIPICQTSFCIFLHFFQFFLNFF